MEPVRESYRKKIDCAVTAVQLNLETKGLFYTKWGDEQKGKRADWLVDNDGEVYTVDAVEFSRTYAQISVGRYLKTAIVWAYQAQSSGLVKTLEGETHYKQGDYVIADEQAGDDTYAVGREKFERMYQRAE